MRIIKNSKAHRVLILNAKGGCGKTTIATNLACQFANENQKTALVDYDPQASSTSWLEARPPHMPPIYCVSAYQSNTQVTRTWQLRVPQGTTRVIVDTPARLDAMTASRLIKEADTILIPVLASAIDIRAAIQFISTLNKDPEFRRIKHRVAVLGNRVRKSTKAYAKLQAYLEQLEIPFITSLRDTQNYVRAAEEGLGVQELPYKSAEKDSIQWHTLVRWIEREPSSSEQKVAL